MHENSPRTPRIALVLAGGAARGAYEVGVIDYVYTEVARALGRRVPIDILCGTSVGAINACGLAAFADEPAPTVRLLRTWQQLRINHVIRLDPAEVFSMARSIFGRHAAAIRRGGVLDPSGLQRIVAASIPFSRIRDNLTAGRLLAVTVSATQVATGKTVVFVQRADEHKALDWSRDPLVTARSVHLTATHALASAALPFVFPAVHLDGEYFCDGALRHNVPLSPARRLGADGMIVISPRCEPAAAPAAAVHKDAFPNPLFLLGKTLNALLLDRIDNDLDRLQRITAVLEAGTRLYGPDFVHRVNREMAAGASATHQKVPHALRPIQTVLIRASRNIGVLAAEFVGSPAFESRATGVIGAFMRRVGAEAEESDLLSYLLFDGEFARQLIELGRTDARARHEELCRFFAGLAAADHVMRP